LAARLERQMRSRFASAPCDRPETAVRPTWPTAVLAFQAEGAGVEPRDREITGPPLASRFSSTNARPRAMLRRRSVDAAPRTSHEKGGESHRIWWAAHDQPARTT
jgi:hypothetical protein